MERRSWPRYQVGWPIKFSLTSPDGVRVFGTASLENVSTRGALIQMDKPLWLGAQVDLSIKLPFEKASWMLYSAEVLRTEPTASGHRVAVEFSPAKPVFTDIA